MVFFELTWDRVLAHIKYHLTKKNLVYAVTAPTGIAAVLIGGVTMHSFFGVGTGENGINYYLKRRGDFAEVIRKRLTEIDVLIVDEISMVYHPSYLTTTSYT